MRLPVRSRRPRCRNVLRRRFMAFWYSVRQSNQPNQSNPSNQSNRFNQLTKSPLGSIFTVSMLIDYKLLNGLLVSNAVSSLEFVGGKKVQLFFRLIAVAKVDYLRCGMTSPMLYPLLLQPSVTGYLSIVKNWLFARQLLVCILLKCCLSLEFNAKCNVLALESEKISCPYSMIWGFNIPQSTRELFDVIEHIISLISLLQYHVGLRFVDYFHSYISIHLFTICLILIEFL